jgi:hypothetical protein
MGLLDIQVITAVDVHIQHQQLLHPQVLQGGHDAPLPWHVACNVVVVERAADQGTEGTLRIAALLQYIVVQVAARSHARQKLLSSKHH